MQSETVLISLIKKALFGIEETLPPDVDWDAVYQEAQAQAVFGLVAPLLPNDCSPETQAKWQAAEYRRIAQVARYWHAHDELDKLLTENGIRYVILKGAAAAMYYPDPLRRAMGDIDFLVPPEQFEQAKALLLENEHVQNHKSTDRHIGFAKDQISFELHCRFSYIDLEMEDAMLSGIARAKRKAVEGHAFFALPPAENGLVLLGHLWNHLHTGVGLRQALDWIIFAYTQLSDGQWDDFSMLFRAYGLKKLAITATRMGQKHFGLPGSFPWCAEADETLCDDLFSEILQAGNFGRKKPRMNEADSKTRYALAGIHRFGFFHYLQERGEVNWKTYHKHPWLKPFAWLYQLFRYPALWLIMPKEHKLSSMVQKENEINDLIKRLK